MPYCPNCRSEYKEGIVRCVDCGAALVPGSPPLEEAKPSYEELVLIYDSSNAVEVDVMRAALEVAGIPVWETGDMAKSVYMFSAGPLGGGRLFVPASRVEDAKYAIATALGRGDSTEPAPGSESG